MPIARFAWLPLNYYVDSGSMYASSNNKVT